MIRFALGAKCGRPVATASSSPSPPNRSGISSEPNATLPIPKLSLDKKRRRLMPRPCSRTSLCIDFYFHLVRVVFLFNTRGASGLCYGFFQVINHVDHL